MGGTFSYSFLSSQTDGWKDKYIKGWSVSGSPFGGNFKYLYDYMGDDDYPADMFKVVRPAERTFSATTSLFPRVAVFGDDVFVQSSTRSYTARPEDIRDYLYALNFTDTFEQYLDAMKMYDDVSFGSPGSFPIQCVIGIGQKTLESAIVEGELRKGASYQVIYGDGDEFVNSKSARRCTKFGDKNRSFFYQELVSEHLELIKGREGISTFVDFVNFLNRGVSRSEHNSG